MDLQSAAEDEKERKTRSKLEPHRNAILTLRRKHWTYRQIAKWLKERGVTTTFTAVYRFCERARRPRNAATAVIDANDLEGQKPSMFETTTTQPKTGPKKHRFNVDI